MARALNFIGSKLGVCLYCFAEFAVQGVCLFKDFLAKSVEISSFASFGLSVNFVFEFVVEVNGLFHKNCNLLVG